MSYTRNNFFSRSEINPPSFYKIQYSLRNIFHSFMQNDVALKRFTHFKSIFMHRIKFHDEKLIRVEEKKCTRMFVRK